ncbi:MAG TPA: hypothetical protein PKW06_04325 [Cyclobacteriaceae bacterium]|nr:hypothetical protein [Cyclobacteriaceae bacterium]
MTATSIAHILSAHVPPAAYGHCFQLWKRFPFDFKLSKGRLTKVGDFTCYPGKVARITVNHDLDPYLFLITYVHEVAHLEVYLAHGNRAGSHGREWKRSFRQLLAPVMNEEVFPITLLAGLKKHMKNPKASTFSDSAFTQLLRSFDQRQKNVVLLSHIPEGTIFGFQGKWFKKGKLRRTRVECRELKTRLSYLVPADAPIDMAQLSLL